MSDIDLKEKERFLKAIQSKKNKALLIQVTEENDIMNGLGLDYMLLLAASGFKSLSVLRAPRREFYDKK